MMTTTEQNTNRLKEVMRAFIGDSKAITVKQAAAYLGIKTRTMQSYIDYDGNAIKPGQLVELMSLLGAEFTNAFIGLAGHGGAVELEPVAGLSLQHHVTLNLQSNATYMGFLDNDGRVCHREAPVVYRSEIQNAHRSLMVAAAVKARLLQEQPGVAA